MSFKINEKVKFLDEKGFGIIKEMYPKSVLIEKDDGFESEFSLNKILKMDTSLLAQIKIDEKVLKSKETIKKKEFNPTQIIEKVREIDLHFGNLIDFGNDYSPHEKFIKQLFEAEKAIIQAKKDKIEKLILIHGKGKGKLEAALYDVLKAIDKIDYYEADFQKYKLGAVEIIFK